MTSTLPSASIQTPYWVNDILAVHKNAIGMMNVVRMGSKDPPQLEFDTDQVVRLAAEPERLLRFRRLLRLAGHIKYLRVLPFICFCILVSHSRARFQKEAGSAS